jgi:hypothetical protein
MAVDDKTLPEMVAGQPPDTDAYCPQCGRPWRDPSPEYAQPVAPLLAVIGLALAIAFGARAARAYRMELTIRSDLAALSTCPADASGPQICPSVADREEWLRVDDANQAATRRQRDRALVGVALGGLALAVGLGSAARRHRASRRERPSAIVAVIWGVGAALIAGACLEVLALYAALVAVRLSPGSPLGWETLDQAADGAIALLSLVTGGGGLGQ